MWQLAFHAALLTLEVLLLLLDFLLFRRRNKLQAKRTQEMQEISKHYPKHVVHSVHRQIPTAYVADIMASLGNGLKKGSGGQNFNNMSIFASFQTSQQPALPEIINTSADGEVSLQRARSEQMLSESGQGDFRPTAGRISSFPSLTPSQSPAHSDRQGRKMDLALPSYSMVPQPQLPVLMAPAQREALKPKYTVELLPPLPGSRSSPTLSDAGDMQNSALSTDFFPEWDKNLGVQEKAKPKRKKKKKLLERKSRKEMQSAASDTALRVEDQTGKLPV